MSIRKTMITMAIMVTVLVIMAGVLQATPPRSSRLFDWRLEPIEPPKGPGVIDMVFEFTPTKLCSIKGCTETEIRVITKGGLEFLGPQSWKQQVKYGETYSQVIQVNIPPDDTCGVWIEMHSPVYSRSRAVAYFVCFTDSVEFWKGSPHGAPRRGPSHSDQMRARMSSETLHEVVTVRLSLTNKHRLIVARLNELVPEMDPTDEPGVFTADVSRDVWLSLISLAGVNCEIIDQLTPPPTR